MPIIKDSYQLLQVVSLRKYTHLRKAIETLQWQGARLLEQTHAYYFENQSSPVPLYALHAYDVMPFNKGKLNKKVEYGRAYQLGRIAGNFVFVGKCTSLHMPDAPSLPAMVSEHETLFDERQLQSIAVDKGYYSHENQRMLDQQQMEEIYLPKPNRVLDAPPTTPLPPDDRWRLHNRRASIEAMISHIKHGGQLGRSRMKSDAATLAAGYASVLGFNLRQLKRCLTRAVRPKTAKAVRMEQKVPD